MATLDEYIDELLAEWQEPSALGAISNNIMDEPISEAVKKHLLKLLIPEPVAPMRKCKLEKLKAILTEIDLYANSDHKEHKHPCHCCLHVFSTHEHL